MLEDNDVSLNLNFDVKIISNYLVNGHSRREFMFIEK